MIKVNLPIDDIKQDTRPGTLKNESDFKGIMKNWDGDQK